MTLWLPEAALIPDQAPEAAQFVASLLDQVRVEGLPLVTLMGLALTVSVAAWATLAQYASVMPQSTPTRNHANKCLFDGTDAGFVMVIFLNFIGGYANLWLLPAVRLVGIYGAVAAERAPSNPIYWFEITTSSKTICVSVGTEPLR